MISPKSKRFCCSHSNTSSWREGVHDRPRMPVNSDLKQEWTKYLEETKTHVTKLEAVCRAFGLDPAKEAPGRAVVRHVGAALVQAMTLAKSEGNPAAAEIVACECVVLAETKDHLDWQLLSKCGENLSGAEAEALLEASNEIEDEEDEHLYHSKGWCRELCTNPGLKASCATEERQHVTTAIGAARAEAAAEKDR